MRIEELEKPPHSKLVLIIDTEIDVSLFSKNEASLLLDTICSAALALIQENEAANISIELGYNGSNKFYTGTTESLQTMLSYPYTSRIGAGLELPSNTIEKNIIVLAMPRKNKESALTNFIATAKTGNSRTIEVFFCYTKNSMVGVANACAITYKNSQNVHTHPCFLQTNQVSQTNQTNIEEYVQTVNNIHHKRKVRV
ncbi:MAG: hypothetical protein Ta2G_16950 [Termitinemataceae bacterium]|nr:MAG: hypothetical protein Ta2G_16950 [Termitinemataceae bacterium]